MRKRYIVRCVKCSELMGFFPGNDENAVCYCCTEAEELKKKETISKKALDELEEILSHPTFSFSYEDEEG